VLEKLDDILLIESDKAWTKAGTSGTTSGSVDTSVDVGIVNNSDVVGADGSTHTSIPFATTSGTISGSVQPGSGSSGSFQPGSGTGEDISLDKHRDNTDIFDDMCSDTANQLSVSGIVMYCTMLCSVCTCSIV